MHQHNYNQISYDGKQYHYFCNCGHVQTTEDGKFAAISIK